MAWTAYRICVASRCGLQGIAAIRADRNKNLHAHPLSSHGTGLSCLHFAATRRGFFLRAHAFGEQAKSHPQAKSAGQRNTAEASRFNTLGIAYMNQQRSADAQKFLEQAPVANSKFAVARLNLGVAFLAQQKLESARVALAAATEQLERHTPISYPYPAGHEYPVDEEHQAYQLEFNTRQRSDRLPPSLRYHYPPPN
jgi:tetratricopeptide (TPR) repeat protein